MKHCWKLIVVSLCLLGAGSCAEKKSDAIVYVNSVQLFEGFKMKTEYDKILERDLKSEAMQIDSLQMIMEHTTDSMTMYRLRKEYYVADQLFNDKFEKLSGTYTASVTERLDSYIKQYAKEKGIKMMLSGNSGGVVYVDDVIDVTEELMKYVNNEFDKK